MQDIECKKCGSALPSPHNPKHIMTQYCLECKSCESCHEFMMPEDMEYCQNNNLELFKHCKCMTEELLSIIESKREAVEQKYLDLLNIAHLMVNPNIELSIDTNCKESEIYGMKWFSELPTLDHKFLALRRLETLAAACSLLLKREPGSKTIKIKLDIESTERFKKASKKDVKYLRCDKCEQKFPELELSAHFKDCLGKTPKTAAKVERIKRTKFEQAIDLMMKYGMTAGEAKVATEAQFAAQGLEITYSE